MPLTQSQTTIANLALMRLGQQPIQSLTDQTDPNAIAVNTAWDQALGEVSRETPWNCLKKQTYLSQLPPLPGSCAENDEGLLSQATVWAPSTSYAVNQYVTYANYLYQCLIANVSSGSFVVDLSRGYWFQTNIFSPNYLGPQPGNAGPLYAWTYGYKLPTDFLLIVELNNNWVWGQGGGSSQGNGGGLFELYQNNLFCNFQYANIKYIKFEPDTTKYDPLFIGALVLNLATILATQLRKDNAAIAQEMRQMYKDYVTEARAKNGGEGKPRRNNLVQGSRFVASRRWSTNG